MSSIFRPQDLRITWRRDLGWIVETPTALSAHQMERVLAFIHKVQADRYLGLAPGERKQECLLTLEDLKIGRVQQLLLPTKEGGAAFQSTERVNKGRTFFHGK